MDTNDFSQMTPNQKRALNKGLAALETMADLWAVEVRLTEMSSRIAAVADDPERSKRIAAMIHLGFIEGAYRHYLDSKDVAVAASAETQAVVFDMLTHLHRQREFSARTFGPGSRTKGVVDHIRKELCEIEKTPADVTEWIDVVILALDGAWRTGASPEQVINALVAKQTKNEARTWPDWRTADPDRAIEHDRRADDVFIATAVADPCPYDGLTEEFIGEVERLANDAPGIRDAVQGALESCNAYIAPQGASATAMTDERAARLDDADIDAIAESMPGGLDSFMKQWGWRQFARAVEDEVLMSVARVGDEQ
ncbi:dATP/dGTP pyrophosphohydrolase domain-containing protein [Ralstonia syzygii]|uniref:dATP/dGTP pyrophosphohydrolase domain-containing protein n=1 Tax=Ralstonia syzygii TaxID=28097 RepID=UPI0018D155BA|nr:dATP/dGTP pyrophosphohydrolase domain-containing protein [Ralstonia syzygii]